MSAAAESVAGQDNRLLDYVNPENRARIEVDQQLVACGWVVQDYQHAAVAEALGVAVREVPTDSGPTDYLLFEVSILSDVSGGPGKPSCGWRKKPGSVC